MEWITPTGHNDPGNGWNNELLAYDDDELYTNATSVPLTPGTWSTFLELTVFPINCSKLRYYNFHSGSYEDQQDVDAFYGGEWHHVFEGLFPTPVWTEIDLGGTYIVTALRYRARRKTSTGTVWCIESDFWGIAVPPGWTGKISGVTNPAKIMGVDVADIAKVKGVTG